tara:strand:+ start:323 stop:547 length:225 start_codon:yes stop_codon:yes gene_type:complete
MVITEYLDRFIIKMVEHYIPEGEDEITHINTRAFMYDIITTLIEEKKLPPKLAAIKYLSMNYKEIIYSKLSVLN